MRCPDPGWRFEAAPLHSIAQNPWVISGRVGWCKALADPNRALSQIFGAVNTWFNRRMYCGEKGFCGE
jgi:hypothetical protein